MVWVREVIAKLALERLQSVEAIDLGAIGDPRGACKDLKHVDLRVNAVDVAVDREDVVGVDLALHVLLGWPKMTCQPALGTLLRAI